MKRTEPSPTRVLIAVDVESRGDCPIRNGIVSVGVVVGRADRSEVLAQQRFDFNPMLYVDPDDAQNNVDNLSLVEQKFDERCLKEFWENEEKFPGIGEKLKKMQANADDPLLVAKQLREFIDHWNDDKAYEAVVISDNVTFDTHFINYYLKAAGCASLSFSAEGAYRSVIDVDSFARGVERMTYDNLWVNDKELIKKYKLDVNKDDHDHMPENDAKVIYKMHVELMRAVQPEGVI